MSKLEYLGLSLSVKDEPASLGLNYIGVAKNTSVPS